jgi:hypothetical protein
MSCAKHTNEHQRKLRSRFGERKNHSRTSNPREKVLRGEKWKDVAGECE